MIQITKEGTNSYRFFLKSSEGSTLLNSVPFESKAEIVETVKGLNPLIEHHVVFERKTDHSGKFLFNLKDGSGKVIGESQRYGSEAGMENGIKNLKNRIISLLDLEESNFLEDL